MVTVGTSERLGRRRLTRWRRWLVRGARPVRSRANSSHLPPRSTVLSTVSSLWLVLLYSEHRLSRFSSGTLFGVLTLSLSVSLNAGGWNLKYFVGSFREFSHLPLLGAKMIFSEGRCAAPVKVCVL